jgi:hypothetical protein
MARSPHADRLPFGTPPSAPYVRDSNAALSLSQQLVGAEAAPGARGGPSLPPPTREASERRGERARWSMFAAHPWWLINDHQRCAVGARDMFPGPIRRFARGTGRQGGRHCPCEWGSAWTIETFAKITRRAGESASRRRATHRRGEARSAVLFTRRIAHGRFQRGARRY